MIWLEHHKRHTPYYDVSLPPEAAAMIHEKLEWTSPCEMAKKVLTIFPTALHQQVHKTWMTMSETLWKRDAEQLSSVKLLLSECKDNVNLLDIPILEGGMGYAKDYWTFAWKICGNRPGFHMQVSL